MGEIIAIQKNNLFHLKESRRAKRELMRLPIKWGTTLSGFKSTETGFLRDLDELCKEYSLRIAHIEELCYSIDSSDMHYRVNYRTYLGRFSRLDIRVANLNDRMLIVEKKGIYERKTPYAGWLIADLYIRSSRLEKALKNIYRSKYSFYNIKSREELNIPFINHAISNDKNRVLP